MQVHAAVDEADIGEVHTLDARLEHGVAIRHFAALDLRCLRDLHGHRRGVGFLPRPQGSANESNRCLTLRMNDCHASKREKPMVAASIVQ